MACIFPLIDGRHVLATAAKAAWTAAFGKSQKETPQEDPNAVTQSEKESSPDLEHVKHDKHGETVTVAHLELRSVTLEALQNGYRLFYSVMALGER